METDSQGVIYIENWNDLCRLCLRNDQPLHNLYCDESFLVNVQEASNINICIDDTLPNSICKACVEQVNSFIEFRERCKATDEWLRNEAASNENEQKDTVIVSDDCEINSKEILLIESNQLEEQLIDDPGVVDDQTVENEIELPNCIVQSEEVMDDIQLSINEETLNTTSTSDFQCNVCGKELLSAYTLVNHMRSHTGERPYGCSVCEKFFKTKSNLNEHYRVHNPELRWMKTSSRDIPSITRVTVTSEDILTCNQCSKVFVSLDELSAHEHTHGDEQFTCEKCNKSFNSKPELTVHIRSNCCSSLELEVNADRQCPFCGKQFRSAATLENHKRVHTREKPFSCELCSKPFRTKGNLLEHKRVHNNSMWLMKSDTKLTENEQKFKCTYCEKPFRTYTALLNHERVHTREKPFECSVCGKCFRTKSNMTEHMKGCHDVDFTTCASDEVQVFTFKTNSVS
ncbi:zinc finger protein 501-like isoform X1 [Daktulosphaira vitifoliae]|uniref:zinc finger protein 501-like isoform X1 n=1 Tax=Daktulosphaira vitifoliae TaxID=58002 RepID=UPI0021A97B5C|nr:zinc finger protein 501-like isoform X1 [Daktulosphaira vitifoliae]